MNQRIVIGPQDSLVKTIVEKLPENTKDFSSVSIVFPGKRPAHFLRKELAARTGTSYLPPKIFSIDDFIVSLYQQHFSNIKRDLEPIDAAVLLHRIHTALEDRLGGEHFNAFDEFLPVGIKLAGELEELHLAHLSENRIDEEIGALSHNRLFSLRSYYKQFYSLVEKSGLSTRAMRYVKVADHIKEISLEQYSDIIITVPFRHTNTEKIIFEEIEKLENVQMLYQSDKSEGQLPEPEIHFIKAPDIHGQVFALSSLIDEQMKSDARLDEHSVIVLPSAESLFPVYHQTLSLLNEKDYNIALGYPVIRTPIFCFLNNLFELVAAKQKNIVPVSLYIKFILHPYTKNIRFKMHTDVTRILFHAIEQKLADEGSKKNFSLDDLEQNDEIFTAVSYRLSGQIDGMTPDLLKLHLVSIHKQTVRAFDDLKSMADFAQKSAALLSFIYEETTARLHPLFRRYAENMIEVFQRIEYSMAGNISFRDFQSYLTFFRQYVGNQEVPFTGTPLRGLQVLGLLETRGLKFNDVYILDMNDEIFPGRQSGDMLLPQQLRQQLGLETRRDHDNLMEYYFNMLIRGAKRIFLFYSESEDTTKSRFVEKLLWEVEKRKPSHVSDDEIKTVHYTMNLANDVIVPLEKTEGIMAALRGYSFSASALDTYLQCPIQFYYRYILNLEQKDEVSDDIEAGEIGNFVHLILKKYYEELVNIPLKPSDLDWQRMERIIEDQFVRVFGKESDGAIFLMKHQILQRLKDYLNKYQLKILENNTVIIRAVEKRITAPVLGVKCQGRIDRIEERNGLLFIIDYKTGIKNGKPIRLEKLLFDDRSSWNKAVYSLQLPLYLLLYKSVSNLPVEKIIPSYLYLGEKTISTDSEVPLNLDLTRQSEDFDKIQELFTRLFREILDPDTPFEAPSEAGKVCPDCPMKFVCGTSWAKK